MKIIVCGGRAYRDRQVLDKVLDGFLTQGVDTLIHGGCPTGADAMAETWGKRNRVKVVTFPANWGGEGRAAGPIRNQRMVDLGADFVVAFPGGRGTADLVRRARKAGLEVVTVGPRR